MASILAISNKIRVGKYTKYGKAGYHTGVEPRLTIIITELKKKRAFRKFSYRGVDLDQYVCSPTEYSGNCLARGKESVG